MTKGKKKITVRPLALIFVAIVLFSSCSKEYQVPQPTPLSSYNLSAYANGELLTFNTTSDAAVPADSIINIYGRWEPANVPSYTYDMNLWGIKVSKGYIGVYSLTNAEYIATDGNSFALFCYQTSATPGTFSITEYDSINKTISGTFTFTAINSNPNPPHNVDISSYPSTITLTNGVFTKVPL
jgi:hypothetical protein